MATGAVDPLDNVSRNSTTMAVGTFGSRILGFIRTALLTAVVGGALAADSFTIANSLPTQVFVLINGGLISVLLIPQITRAMLREDGGQDFSDRLVTLCLIVLAVVTIGCMLAAPTIVGWLTRDPTEEFLSLTTMMAYICLPQIFFYGLYSILGQILNVRGRFVEYAWAPAWANIVQIAGLVYFVVRWGQQATVSTWTADMIWVLGGTTTLGIVVQGVCLIVPLARSGFSYRPRFGWRGYGFGDMSRMTAWTVAALAVAQLYGFVATLVMSPEASTTETVAGNGVAAYAYSLYILPHSLITISIITALFPAMSRAHEKGDLVTLRKWLVKGLTTPAVLVLPASAALIALGRPMAATLFPGTRYLPEQGIDEPGSIAVVLALMAIGTMPFGITALKQRYCFARGDGWLNFWLVAVLMSVNFTACGIAYWATPPRHVVAVIAGGTSVANIVAATAFLIVARRQVGNLGLARITRLWVRLTIASAIAGVLGWLVATLVTDPSGTWLEQATALGAGGMTFVVAFLVAAKSFRITEIDTVVTMTLSRVRSLRH